MTDYEKLKGDMEEWLQQLGIEPPVGIHDYVPLVMNRVQLDNRMLLRHLEEAEGKIVGLKDALSHNADRYTVVEVRNYATGTKLFIYSFRECEPQVGDIIKERAGDFPIVGRQWIDGKLYLLVSNAGAVKAGG